MPNSNILDQLFQIKNLKPATLLPYFEALQYVCLHQEEGIFLYGNPAKTDEGLYMVEIADNEIICCSYSTKEMIDIDSIVKQATENYGFVLISIDDDRAIVLDHVELRLLILKPVENLMNLTKITLARRTIPFGQSLKVTLTAPPPL